MKQIKWISLLLMLAMVITACATVQQLPSGGTGNETDHNTDGQETVEVDLPDNLTYDGETIRLYTCENTLGVSISDFSEENATDVVTSALHNRMLNIEDRLGVTFELINTDVHTEMADIVSASIGSDSDDFDMVFSPALNIVGLVQQGMFIGIEELPYIDLEKPWWGSDYIRSVSVNQDYPYIMFGDINWNYLQRCTATFVNLRLLDDTLHMTSADMYNLVFNDEWTQDKMFELQSGVYSDVDGSTTRNEGDIFGFVHCGNWFFEYMMFGSGLTFTGRDNNGYPTLELNNQKTHDCIDSVGRFFWRNKNGIMSNDYAKVFARGEALFMVNRIFLSDWDDLREMKDQYAIIPVPKYAETSEGYHCVVEKLVQWGVVPVTAKRTEMISSVAELMAYEGYKNVTPAYYETTLKIKRLTDEEEIESAKKVIDIICRGARTDFVYINELNGMESIFTYVCNEYQNNFASLYAEHEVPAEMKLSELIERDMELQQGR